MEIASSAITGAMRVGVQVVSSHKLPALEIYHQVRNISGPEHEYDVPMDIHGKNNVKQKHRFQDVFVEFTLVNIGGSRAENVKLSLSGELKRNYPRQSFGDLFDVIIPQMPPGQSRFLFRFDQSDLMRYPEGGGKALGIKDQSFTISIEYDSGKGFLNSLMSLPSRLRGKRKFREEYTFSPKLVTGDLPPAEYA